MRSYNCLYNLDMSIIPLSLSAYRHSFQEKITKAHVKQFVQDAAGTGVDAFFCSPTLLRQPLWKSKILPHWENEAKYLKPPVNRSIWTASERTYYPMREYILNGGCPVDDVFFEVKNSGMDFFFSLRMNDWHFVEFDEPDRYPTLDSFYVKHPEYHINSLNIGNPIGWDVKNKNQQNYMIPEVREHYLALLNELIENWDIDGIELDFMRSPNYFPLEQLKKGTGVMSDFVRQVRNMLDVAGRKRNKELPLCVRMPHRYEYCAKIGFDVKKWVESGWVQMVNISSSYIHSEAIEIEAYHEALPNSFIYGEEQMIINNCINKYGWPAERRTPKEILETTAYSFLRRGAYGVSIFNFPCTREIEQPTKDPDSIYSEPPREVLSHITDIEYLKHCSKHYFSYGYNDLTFDGKLPAKGHVITVMHIWDNIVDYQSAAIRIICKDDIEGCKKAVRLNGEILVQSQDNNELFKEDVIEGQFPSSQTFNCIIPLNLLKPDNTIEICLNASTKEIFGVELALYSK